MKPLMLLLAGGLLLTGCSPLPMQGEVFNQKMEPIAGATFTIKPSGQTAFSDSAGKATIKGLGIYDTLLITADGYHPREVRMIESWFLFERGLITIVLDHP